MFFKERDLNSLFNYLHLSIISQLKNTPQKSFHPISFPALGGSDYTNTYSDETFTPGSANGVFRCLEVKLLDDNAFEGNHVFLVTLITADSNVVLGTSETEITILDNYG